MITSKHVTTIEVIDPDSNAPVIVEIRKLDTGAMVGIDGSWLEQVDDNPYSPYDGTKFVIPNSEYRRNSKHWKGNMAIRNWLH
jgi:hypothetical protein